MKEFASLLVPLLPALTLFIGSLVVLFIRPNSRKSAAPFYFYLGTTLVAMALTLITRRYYEGIGREALAFSGLLVFDPFSAIVSLIIVTAAFICGLFTERYRRSEEIEVSADFYSLLLMATGGALVFVCSAHLLLLFVALETMSMALYALCGCSLVQVDGPATRRSAESALKYFFLGSFSSAFLLFGIAILYGLSGTFSLFDLGLRISPHNGYERPALSLGVGLTLVGLLFKLGAVPFHFWTPDVYEGSPTVVTSFMASVVKVAATAITMRILWLAFGGFSEVWAGGVSLVAGATIVFANVVAVRQRNVKRMLAYSSIAHGGYLVCALLSTRNVPAAGAAMLFYLVVYTLTTIGAFTIVAIVNELQSGSNNTNRGDIAGYRQLGYRRPWLAGVFTFFLLSLAGLPPGVAGLLGKVYLFQVIVQGGYERLAVLAALGSAVSCYYYLRVIVAMYFEPPEGEPGVEVDDRTRGIGALPSAALGVCTVGMFYLGIFPSQLWEYVTLAMGGF